MSLLVAGRAHGSPPANGRQRATSTRRWASDTAVKATTLWETFVVAAPPTPPSGARKTMRVPPEAQLVALLQAPAPAHALAVDERAVARQAVVGQRPGLAHALELGVHARDALVPVQRQVDALAAPDGQPLAVGRAGGRVLGLVAVAQQQERLALALGEDALLHLDRRGRVRVRGGELDTVGTADRNTGSGRQARALACGSRRVIVTAASSAAAPGPR